MQRTVWKVDKATSDLLGKLAAYERRKKIDEIRFLISKRILELGISLD
jgi:hypothetical protein